MTVVLAVAVGMLVAAGVYLMLQRSLTRIVIGFGLLGHGANLLLLAAGGRALTPPFVGEGEAITDPLAQAMVLTAIVIGFGMTGFLLALAYRSWRLQGDDDVEDDVEDRRIAAGGGPPTRALGTVVGVNVALTLPVALCLLAAGVSLALHRWRAAQRVVSVAVVAAAVVDAAVLLAVVDRDGPQAVTLGDWSPLVGITYVADQFSALLLLVSLVTVLAVLVFAIGQPNAEDDTGLFHPVYLVLVAGVSASFLTGDLFHLFVAFEVMLVASYVLLTLGGRREQVRSGMTYMVINLVSATLLLMAVGLVYAATGTVNLAELSVRMADLPPELRGALAVLLFAVLGIKAAIVPLYFWLPDSYPTAPTAVTAVFAGLLTKVGVYAIIRVLTLLDPGDGPSPFLLTVAALTMVIGVLGAIAQDDMKRILSFHIVSQVGYMLFGLALWSPAGLAAATFFIAHQIPVKTSLFLTTGMVEEGAGTASLKRLGGMIRRMPAAAVLFGLAALSLAGLPPFSGFVAKLGLVEAGFAQREWFITAVSVAISLFTLFSMTKIWGGVFWGQDEAPRLARAEPAGTLGTLRVPWLMTASNTALVGVTLAIALFAGVVYTWCVKAADGLLDPAAYVQAVLGVRARLVTVVGAALVWTVLWGDFDARNVVAGLAIGLAVSLAVPRRHLAWRLRPLKLLALVGWFAVALMKANLTVAWQVLTWPERRFRPAVVEVPVAAAAPGLLAVVANLITLTPGTLTVDADPDRRVLRVHALHLEDRASLRRSVIDLERRVVEALAPDDLRDAARQRWRDLGQAT